MLLLSTIICVSTLETALGIGNLDVTYKISETFEKKLLELKKRCLNISRIRTDEFHEIRKYRIKDEINKCRNTTLIFGTECGCHLQEPDKVYDSHERQSRPEKHFETSVNDTDLNRTMTKVNEWKPHHDVTNTLMVSDIVEMLILLLLADLFYEWWKILNLSKDTTSKSRGNNCEKIGQHSTAFLKRLGLGQFFPGKMELMDVMKITNNIHHIQLSDIPIRFLKNIIMLNHNARDKKLEELLEKIATSKNDDKSCCMLSIVGDEESEHDINPLDLTVALFRCASQSLVQILSLKLFVCQLAIPLVLPTSNGYSLLSTLSLRSIVLEDKSSARPPQHMAIDCPCHVVGFCRLGRPGVSKSRLLNEVLSDKYHSTCLSKDSPLGTTRRLFSDGLIESTWYQPSIKSKTLKDMLLFLNLRGDGSIFSSQLNVMIALSSIAIVFLEIDQLKEEITQKKLQQFHNNVSGLIIALDASKHPKPTAKKELEEYMKLKLQYSQKTKYIILAMSKNTRCFSDIKKKIRESVSDLSKDMKKTSLADILKKKELRNIDIDENNTVLQKARQNAEKLVERIPENSLTVKASIVPLQGKPWQEWSEKVKTLNKSSLHFTPQQENEIKKDMKIKRKSQRKLMQNNKEEFVKNFVNKVDEMLVKDNYYVEFMLYMKFFLDQRSRSVLQEYLAKYQADWQAMKSARDKNEKDNMEQLKKELDESEQNLAEASFGLEHILRELGQMYEAVVSIDGENDMDYWYKQLPNVCAKMLLKGQPFEIMDGDVANVPLVWVKAVLNNLKDLIGNKKMLALSVLGIQSSGKSTLLNTMFGLQFAVSAGRCTRGVLLQLVPVADDNLPFDYVLVIDTEGLRAPELAHQKFTHNNWLATYAIGLGDVTIINTKGENTAEVKYVLQIAVHAFLRLKLANSRLNLKQSCIFVHQNVTACGATDKMMMQRRQKLVETLDRLTKEAAIQEDLADIVSFNQVIDFDSEKNVWYFSDLWQGDPPMAPANPGYSSSVKDVKRAILFRLTKGRTKYPTITDTITRIEDLWNGILRDDFVFSFRNTLEVKAYKSMEIKFQASIWEIEKFIFDFVAKEGNILLMNCKSTYELENAVPSLALQLQTEVTKQLILKKEELDFFIEQSTLKDIMKQWSQSKHDRLTMLVDNLTRMAKTDLNKTKEEIKVDRLRRKEEKYHQMEIIEIARKIANKVRGRQPSDNVLKTKFEDMWNYWINRFNSNQIEFEDGIPINEQIESLICDKFPADLAFKSLNEFDKVPTFYQSLLKLEGSVGKNHILKEHLSIHQYLGLVGKEKKDTCKQQAVDVTNVIFRKIDDRIKEIESMDIRFNRALVTEILNMIIFGIEDHNKHKKNDFKFNLLPPFRIMLVTHVVKYVTVVFTKLNDRYIENYSPKAQMRRYRETLWTLFTNVVKNAITAWFFKQEIASLAIDHICSLLPMDVTEKILIRFSHEKYTLMKKIMEHLAKENNFERFKSFILDPYNYAKGWLTDYTNTALFENGNLFFSLANKHIDTLFLQVYKSIETASVIYEAKRGLTVSDWRYYFLEDMRKSNCFPLPNYILVHVESSTLSEVKSFKQILIDQKEEMKKRVMRFFANATASRFTWKEDPIPKIMDKLWGCKELCMFCKEPCMITDTEHFDELSKFPHKCIQHRPEGLGGWRQGPSHKLSGAFCNYLVQSDTHRYKSQIDRESKLYKKYKDEYPNWDIQPTSDTSKYWMWVMCKYEKELAEMHKAELPDIPLGWRKITYEEVIESLET